MIDVLLLANLVGGAIGAVAEGVAKNSIFQNVVGARADAALTALGLAMGDRIAGKDGSLPRNHDVERAVRLAHIQALRAITAEYVNADRDDPERVVFADLMRQWLNLQVTLTSVDTDWPSTEALAESVGAVLSGSVAPSVARLRCDAEAAAWTELELFTRKDRDTSAPQSFRAHFFGDGGARGWYPVFGAFVGRAIKDHEKFKSVFSATTLASIAVAITEFAEKSASDAALLQSSIDGVADKVTTLDQSVRTGFAELLRHFEASRAAPRASCTPEADERSNLRYLDNTTADDHCLAGVLSAEEPPAIQFSDEIRACLARIGERERSPEPFWRQHATYQRATSGKERERVAEGLHGHNHELANRTGAAVSICTDRLWRLLRNIKEREAPDHLSHAALKSFTAFAGLRVVKALKDGYDIVEHRSQPWFQSYVFDDGVMGVYVQRVPEPSATGQRVFGRRWFVTARVGADANMYERVLMPFDVALPLFRSRQRGDAQVFYSWILPQLVLNGAFYDLEAFDAEAYEVQVLSGGRGREWDFHDFPCPWPEALASVGGV